MVDFLIRVDATNSMGVGHVMRCLALAQQCQEQQMNILFVCANLVDMCQQRILINHFKIHQLTSVAGSLEDAAETIAVANQYQAKAILVDGYHFSNDYFDSYKAQKVRLWMIDDFDHAPPHCELVINFQAWADPRVYASTCKQFLGLEYYLLRKEFWPYIPQRSATSQKNTILVMMGGTDPNHQMQRVLSIIDKLHLPLEVSLVLGIKNQAIEQYAKERRSNIRITVHTNPDNIPQLMQQASFAITAGGGTSWELAFMRVPSMVIVQAENQIKVAEYVEKLGVGLNLGSYDQLSDQILQDKLSELVTNGLTRVNMRSAASKLHIGKKVSDIVNHIKSQCGVS